MVPVVWCLQAVRATRTEQECGFEGHEWSGMSAYTVGEAFLARRGAPDRRSFRYRCRRGRQSVRAAAQAGTTESAVHGLSRGEGGTEDRGGY